MPEQNEKFNKETETIKTHTHTHTHTHTLIQELKNTVTELRNSTEKFNRDSTKQKKESVYLKTGHFKLSSQRSEKEKEWKTRDI